MNRYKHATKGKGASCSMVLYSAYHYSGSLRLISELCGFRS